MRIIAGKFKGQILRMPKGAKMRPTSQKVKEALFDILGPDIAGAAFLELFAGSGSIGIEAKSRGAGKVFLVEQDPRCIKAIQGNLKQLQVSYNYVAAAPKIKHTAQVSLLPFSAERAIKLLEQSKVRFDFVFVDPPYYQEQLKNTLIKLGLYDILSPRCLGLVIAEHHKRQVLPHALGGLRLKMSKGYGDTVLSFYQKEGAGCLI